MYDASLDQFKPHSWNIPNVWLLVIQEICLYGRNNFSVTNSEENYIEEQFEYFEKNYDDLAVRAEDFWYRERTNNGTCKQDWGL
jgi:hypothetical protein